MSEDQFDLTKCPDCGRKQRKPKKLGDNCDNDDCECYVTKDRDSGKPLWWNENWDVPDDYYEE